MEEDEEIRKAETIYDSVLHQDTGHNPDDNGSP